MASDGMFAPIEPNETPQAAPEEWRPLPPPAQARPTGFRHPKLGEPSEIWAYRNKAGLLEGYVCRFETVESDVTRRKEFRPLRWGVLVRKGKARTGWHWKGWGDNRPLYGLPELLARLDAAVIVTEGEKAADAARRLFPKYVAVSPMNGARSPHKSEWTQVAGRKVIIWPDHDETGLSFSRACAKLAYDAGAAVIAVVAIPREWPEGWDLADMPPDGVSTGSLTALLDSAQSWDLSPGPRSKEPASEAEIAAEVHRLAVLSPIKYEMEREAAAKKLGIRVIVLDRLVSRERGGGGDDPLKPGQGRPVEIVEADPWTERVDGTLLLAELAHAIREYVVLSPRQADAVALWVVFTHAFAAFDFSPKLVISSPEKRSGKTRLVEVAERLARRPLFVSGISPAALLRVIEQHAPAMLIDEIDALMRGNVEMAEALRGLINSGFTRAGARIIKNVPSPEGGFEPRAFSSWCPMLLAGIGKLPDTVADRSIIIAMARKRPDEKVKRLRAHDGDELRHLGRQAARWAADHFDALKLQDPQPPEQLNDRAADAWSPLFAIADLAGDEWPARARKAAIEPSGDSAGAGEMLLADLRELFIAEPSGLLFTREITAALHKREDRPWSEWAKAGKPITGRQVAALLKPFGIKTNQTVRRDAEHDKGYRVEWFEDAFTRNLSPSLLSIGDVGDIVGNTGVFEAPIGDKGDGLSPIETAGMPQKSSFVTEVTDRNLERGDKRDNGDDDVPFEEPEPAPPDGPRRGRVII
jgi:hypothetical protein